MGENVNTLPQKSIWENLQSIEGQDTSTLLGFFIIRNFPRFFRWLGAELLTQEEIKYYQYQTYPAHYSFLYNLYFILYLIIALLGGFFLPYFTLRSVQEFLFGRGSIFFHSGSSVTIFSALFFFGFLLIAPVILGFFVNIIASQRFKDYLRWNEIKSGLAYRDFSLWKPLLLLSVIYFLIMSPFMYFNLTSYVAIFPNRLVTPKILSITPLSYSLSKIQNILVFSRVEQNNDKSKIIISSTISLPEKDPLIFNDISEIYQLVKVAKSLNLPLIVEAPSEEVLSQLQYENQNFVDQFNLIFLPGIIRNQ